MNTNTLFLNKYNTLDNYLKRLVNASDGVNLISYLERLLPPNDASQLKTLRKYKNDIISHSSLPGYKCPIIPNEWNHFLDRMLKFCMNNKDYIRRKISNSLSEKSHTGNPRSAHITNNKRNLTKCDFCPFSVSGKCTNFSYYYGGQKLYSPTRYGMAMATKKQEPCPSDVITKFENYLKKK